jgi:peroxiredoxin
MVLINDNSKVLQVGDPMPHFTLPATDESTIDSKALDAPVLAIVFTCNHCPYAQAYEDRLKALYNEFATKGVQFILICSNDAVNYPEDAFEEMKKRAMEQQYQFPYCQDESQDIARAYGALCTPHTFVFDRERRLQYKGQVDDNWKNPNAVKRATLRDAIAALVAGSEPAVKEANAIGCSIKWKPSVLS